MFKNKIIKKCYNPLCLNYDIEVTENIKMCPKCNEKLLEFKNKSSKISLAFILSIIGTLSVLTLSILFILPIFHSPSVQNIKVTANNSKPIEQPTPEPSIAPKPNVILRIHGSNTIGAKLAPVTAEGFLKKKGATDIKTVPSNTADEMLIVGTLDNKPQAIEIFAHGSGTAYEDLASGICDIGMSSRKINAQELDNLNKAGLGILTSSACEYILGLDGIAIIVNSNNIVSKLTKDQLKQIFSGEISDWSKVGGAPGTIHVYARDDKSGTYDTFKTLILGSGKLAENAKRYEDSTKLSEGVSTDLMGIGFIGLPYINNTKSVAVSDQASVASILPTRFSVATEDYPITRRLYYYLSTQNKNTLANDFVKYALSNEGEKIVTDIGFVSQNIQIEKITSSAQNNWINPENMNKYVSLIGTTPQRFSLSFRFDSASSLPDNKALRDLDRVVQYLNENKDCKILLLGFSDNIGVYDTNVKLSESRAISIKDALVARDPSIATRLIQVGFGPENPVSTNDTEDGKIKNRRVEMWLTK